MATTDGELVFMSKRRFDDLCRTIDVLIGQLKAPIFAYTDPTECSCEEET